MKTLKTTLILLAVASVGLTPFTACAYDDYVQAGGGDTKIYHDWWGQKKTSANAVPTEATFSAWYRDTIRLDFFLVYNDSSWIYGGTQTLSWEIYVNGSYDGWGYIGYNTGGWQTKSGYLTGYDSITMYKRGWNHVEVRLEAKVSGGKKSVRWSDIWIYVY